MMDTKPPTLPELIEMARRGQDEDREKIDAYLKVAGTTSELCTWAFKTIFGQVENNNERDLAAKIFMAANDPAERHDLYLLERCMIGEQSPLVRYRLALALHKWGYHSPDVRDVLLDATTDPNVGDLAQALLKS